ncbi:G/T mismatch-specific thymine DNA glycosylase-like [Belonocnema kinseyi]|uniref:G/T mismatch-specific thymine DNA glycosylase-like n=1 Tax=Belonocnema kinseyi TaxID=2817044 RepID=UPI00143DA732|nr:G/T mismatch-specific thymine DNA glycosylase-like [Belonocnema kinseyi]
MSKLSLSKLKKSPPALQTKLKAKPNRFNGLTEEEIQKNSPPLPDYLEKDLDLVFVGINPSLTAAYRGRYYAGPGNHFYKLLHESGLVPRFVNFEEDHQLLQFGIGLTNIVDRATRSSADLSRAEIKEGSTTIDQKLREFKPRIAVFNGKCIYEVFANKTGKSDFNFGLQPQRIGETALWVVPSSSARCSTFPRMVDKLQFYSSLKKYLSYLKGEISEVDVNEFAFKGKHKHVPSTLKMWGRKNKSPFFRGGGIAKDKLSMDFSDDDVSSVNTNEFKIKEIISKDGIERLQENVEPKTYSVSGTLSARKEKTKTNKNSQNTPAQVSITRPKKIEEQSDFMTLIKQRLEAKKRKVAENVKNCEGLN